MDYSKNGGVGVEMNLGNFGGGQNFFQKIGKNTRKYPILACFSAKFGGGANFFLKKMGGGQYFFVIFCIILDGYISLESPLSLRYSGFSINVINLKILSCLMLHCGAGFVEVDSV